jgi:hypothetical protein
MSATVSSANAGPEAFGYVTSAQLPSVVIDEKIVMKQKEKALKELESRVQLALTQHNQMYQLQRSHIIAEHDRQLLLAKSAIEDEKSSALMALEQSYQQNLRGIDHAAQTQKISIEQQANLLELHALQQEMAMKHAERERQWAAGYATGATMIQPSQFQSNTFSAPSQYVTSYSQGGNPVATLPHPTVTLKKE